MRIPAPRPCDRPLRPVTLVLLLAPFAALGAPADFTQEVDVFRHDGINVASGICDVPFSMPMWHHNGEAFTWTKLSGAVMDDKYQDDLYTMAVDGAFGGGTFPKSPLSNRVGGPGYLKGTVNGDILVEATSTQRCVVGRLTYPSGSATGSLVIGPGWNNSSDASVNVDKAGEITGYGTKGDRGYKIYFALKLDRAFASTGQSGSGSGLLGYGSFPVNGQPVLFKMAMSYVSVENARLNLATEVPAFDFDGARTAAHDLWNGALGKIAIEGGQPNERSAFYTAFYRALFHPNTHSDVNGDFWGFDDKSHTAKGYTQYHTYSGWDIYRAQSPLLSWLFPRQASDQAWSLVVDARAGGGCLPLWTVANRETGVMEGAPSTSIIANPVAFGSATFDVKQALAVMDSDLTLPTLTLQGKSYRINLADYIKLGYAGPVKHGWSSSLTLEYSIADFSLAQSAAAMGDTARYRKFLQRSQNWKNLFNPATGWIEAKDLNGNWLDGAFTEADKKTGAWMMTHNRKGLVDLMGGNQAAFGKLEEVTTVANFNVNNEPQFGVVTAYCWAGAPWRSQEVIRSAVVAYALNSQWADDDLGTLSAFRIFAMMGMIPAIHGYAGFVLNGPLFPKLTVQMGNGKVLRITGDGAAYDAPYIQSVKFNGADYPSCWLPLSALAKDTNTLAFVMGKTANKAWASRPEDAPPSFDGNGQPPTPILPNPDEGAPPGPRYRIYLEPGRLRLTSPAPMRGIQVRVTDLRGGEIARFRVPENSRNASLALPPMPADMMVVRVIDGSGEWAAMCLRVP